jgi:anti-anti-sigma regulatory factor
MGGLGVAVVTDFATGIVDVTARGVLDVSAASVIRGAVVKAAAEGPRSILVDLNDTTITDRRAAALFIALAGRLSDDLIGFALHVVPGDTADLLHQVLAGCVPVRDDRSAAIAALTDAAAPRRRLHMHLTPVPEAVAQARTLVDIACANWGLDVDRDSARLVVSELVTNVVQHARTELDVSVVCTGTYLVIQVRDCSSVMPALSGHGFDIDRPDGWGLSLVDATVAGWGFHATDTGKTVWATLRLRPMTAVALGQGASAPVEATSIRPPDPDPPPAGAAAPGAGRRGSDATGGDVVHLTPGQVWRQARKAAGLAPTVLSPLTVRPSADRGAIYAGVRLLRALLWNWERTEPRPPGPTERGP